ncbi:unnamed protein product [Dicrocoelium dendriticum]|nr:unnamed protein product [Dicrocoelium dendriticum]
MSQPEFDLCGCVYTNVDDAYQKTRVTVCTQLHHSSLEIHFLGIVNSNCITQARFLCANIHNSSNMYSATSVQYQIFADVRGTSAVKAMHIAPVETYMWNSKYEVANNFQARVLQKAMLSWIRSNEHNITNIVRIEQQLVLPYTEIVRLSTESKVFSNTMGLPFISRIHSDFIPRNKSRPVVTRLTCTFPVEVQRMRSLYLAPGSFKRSLLWQRECYGLKRYNSQRKRNRWYLSSHQIMKSFPQSLYTGHTQRDPLFYQRLHKKLDIHYRPTNKYNLLQVNMFNVSHPIEKFFNNTDHCLSNSEFGMNHLEIPQLAVVRRADANTCGPSALQAVESEEGISKLTIYHASATGSRYVEKGARFLSLPHPGVEQSIKADVLSPECCRLDDASIFSFKGPFGGLLNQNQHSLIYAHSKFQTLPSGINIDHICHWSTVILHLALTISFEYSLLGFCGIFPNYAAKHQEIGLDDTSNSRGQLERRCNNRSQAVFHISYFGFLINSLPYCLTSLLYNLESRPQLYTSRKNSITIEEAVSVKASKTRHISAQGELKTCWISTTKLVTKQYYGCTVEIDLEDVSKLSSECLELNSCHTHFVESPNYRGSNERRATVLQDSKNTERILFKTEQGSCTPNILDYSKQKGKE